MKKIAIILISFSLFSCDELTDALTKGLTEDEISEGLKEALDVGLKSSVASASATDGYFKNEAIKLLLPADLQTVQNQLATGSVTVGIFTLPYKDIMNAYVLLNPNVSADPFDELIQAMNKGAEKAATKALPIFASALVNMSISDALSILQGDNTAATKYFQKATKVGLQTAFQPDISEALTQTKANEIYNGVYGFMNYKYEFDVGLFTESFTAAEKMKITLPESLDEYATDKAIDGLFHLVGEEEQKIRANPLDYASSIIQKVFNSSEAKGL